MFLVSLERLLWIAIAPANNKVFVVFVTRLKLPKPKWEGTKATQPFRRKSVVRLNTGANLGFSNGWVFEAENVARVP